MVPDMRSGFLVQVWLFACASPTALPNTAANKCIRGANQASAASQELSRLAVDLNASKDRSLRQLRFTRSM